MAQTYKVYVDASSGDTAARHKKRVGLCRRAEIDSNASVATHEVSSPG